ncbi:hypothetical protein CPB83DRAFT_861686 [Crepidotus variabilis]|uniref:F-box domain-containing protein n=1 Tax=Crepidotus variabilis TaxID=179855 RepID=A0A9P6E7T6_9AGAR|nr:hypothetical protein CPB83DRAFT_861686 [Crepidotus variabilis]
MADFSLIDVSAISLRRNQPEWSAKALAIYSFKFPFEIISEILLHACQVERKGDRPIFSKTPLFLCQVCKAWKRYIITTPAFWTTIIVVLRKSDLRSVNVSSGLSRWLRRSSNQPLDIFLDGVGAFQSGTARSLEPLKLIASARARWRTMEFHCISSRVCELLAGMVDKDFTENPGNPPLCKYPNLISFASTARTSHTMSPFDLNDAKLLKTLMVNGCPPSFTGLLFHRVANITKISMRNIEGMPSGRVLSWYPNLKEGTFVNIQVHEAFQAFSDDKVTHENLQSLTIDGERWRDVVCLFHTLSAPQLETLALDIDITPNTNIMQDIHALILRSTCNLTHLHIPLVSTEEMALTKMLSLTPNLRKLHIRQLDCSNHSRGLSRMFFDSFYPLTSTTSTFLPNLQNLNYSGNLSVDSIDFLEPLVLRARMLPMGHHLPSSTRADEPTFPSVGPSAAPTRKLAFAKIKANKAAFSFKDQNGEDMSDFMFQVITLVEADRLWLMNENGRPWFPKNVH